LGLRALNYLYSRVLTMKRASWFTFLLLLSISCLDSPDCFELNHNLVGISFKVMGTGKPDTLRFYNIQLSGTDSIFIPGTNATAIGFPLDFTTDNTRIFFQSYRGKDTLHMGYQVHAQFVSEDCGSRFVLKDLDLFRSTFDSVRIISRTPGNKLGNNLEIYRCPRTDTMAIAFRQLTISPTGARSSQSMSVALKNVTPDFTGSPLYVNQRVGIVYLPVNMTDPNMVVNFDLQESSLRELRLKYELNGVVRYKPCGYQTFAQAMEILASDDNVAFDSVSFVRDDNNRPIRSVLDPFDPMMNIYRCPQTNIAGIYFRKSSNVADTVEVNEIRVDGVAIPLASTSLQFVNVALNPSAASTKVEFDFQVGGTKSITISHTRTDNVNFSACGLQGLFTDLELTATDFDTVGTKKDVRIPVTNLQSVPTKNIEIIQQ
jgi:hypothetical protein